MASKQDPIRIGYVYKKVKSFPVLTFDGKRARHNKNGLYV